MMILKNGNLLRKGILILFAAFMLFAASALSESADTVLMIYMTGSDLESIGGAASADLEEMMDALPELPNGIQVVVMASGAKEWKLDISKEETAIFEIAHQGLIKVRQEDVKSMGTPETLSDFLSWTYENYPAEQYALILWDHGAGPLMGLCFDELFPDPDSGNGATDKLTVSELQTALENSPFQDRPLMFVGFDACLMASYEVADAIHPFTDVMIASQETEPDTGWDYHFLSNIRGSDSGETWARVIIDSFADFYRDSPKRATLSGLNLMNFESVSTEINYLFQSLEQELNTETYINYTECRAETKVLGGTTSSSYDLVDLQDLLTLYQEMDVRDTSELRSKLQDMVIAQAVINDEYVNGLSIYYPFDNKEKYISSWQSAFQNLNHNPGYRSFIKSTSDIYLGESLMNWQGEYQTTMQEENGTIQIRVELSDEEIQNIARSRMIVMEELQKDTYQFVYYADHVERAGNTLYQSYHGEALYLLDADGNIQGGPISYFPVEDGVAIYGIMHFDFDFTKPFDEQIIQLPVRAVFRENEDGTLSFSELLASSPDADNQFLPTSASLSSCLDLEIVNFGPIGGMDGIRSLNFQPFYPELTVDIPYPDNSIRLAFLPLQGANQRYAYLRFTDMQNDEIYSNVEPVLNPTLISLAKPQKYYSSDLCSIEMTAMELVTGYHAGIKCVFQMYCHSPQSIELSDLETLLDGTAVKKTAWYPRHVEAGSEEEITIFICRDTIVENTLTEIHEMGFALNAKDSQGNDENVIFSIPLSLDVGFFNSDP